MSNKHPLSNILASNAYWTVNKFIATTFKSNDLAILLAELVYMFEQNDYDWFSYLREEAEITCNISNHEQRKHLATLERYKIIKMEKRGMPQKFYYFIDFDELLKLLFPEKAAYTESKPWLQGSASHDSHGVEALYIRKNIKEKKRKEKGIFNEILNSEKITLSEFILTIKPKELYKDFAELQKVDLKIIFRKFLKYNRKNVFDIETWNEHLLKWFRVTYKDEKAIFSNEQITDDHKIELEIYAHLDGPKLSKRTYGISMLNYGY